MRTWRVGVMACAAKHDVRHPIAGQRSKRPVSDGTASARRAAMARALPIAFLLIVTSIDRVAAVEIATDAAAGGDFLYLTSDVRQGLLDDRLVLGAGYALVSDLRSARHGARGGVELDMEPLTVGVTLSGAPAQDGLGWLWGSVRGGGRHSFRAVTLEVEGALLARRAGVLVGALPVAVDQLQAELDATLTFEERGHAGLTALLSFYDPDLGSAALRGAETGLLVSVAGRPERWALTASAGARFAPSWELELALGAAGYADGDGRAWLPRIGLRAGPKWGFTVEAAAELVIGAGEAARDPMRAIGTLSVEWAR